MIDWVSPLAADLFRPREFGGEGEEKDVNTTERGMEGRGIEGATEE
jgi:hypothetical protein